MTQKDRDNLFSMMVFYDKLTTWRDDATSEITDKDRIKLKIITDMIMAMLVQYQKREGKVAMDSLLTESKNFQFVILKNNEQVDLSGTFEPDILKGALKNIVSGNIECSFCDKTDYKNCDWFTLHNFMGTPNCNSCKNKCPYKFDFGEF